MTPNLLNSIEPPSGGLDGLRNRIQRHQRRRAAITAAAVAGVALSWFGFGPSTPMAPGFADQHPYGRLALATPAEPVRIIGGVALEWPSTQSSTRIYLVDSRVDDDRDSFAKADLPM